MQFLTFFLLCAKVVPFFNRFEISKAILRSMIYLYRFFCKKNFFLIWALLLNLKPNVQKWLKKTKNNFYKWALEFHCESISGLTRLHFIFKKNQNCCILMYKRQEIRWICNNDLCYIFVSRKLDESEAVSLLDISVQNLTFLPARLFQVSLLVQYMGTLTVNPLIPRLVTHYFSESNVI